MVVKYGFIDIFWVKGNMVYEVKEPSNEPMLVPIGIRLTKPKLYFDYQPENRFLYLDSVELSAGRFAKIADMGHMVVLSKENDSSRSFYFTDPLLIRADEFINLGRHLVELENFDGLIESCRKQDSYSVVAYDRLQVIAKTHHLSVQQIHTLVSENYFELFAVDGGVGIKRLLIEPWP